MKPSEFEILSLIPQRQPMVMIDRLTKAGEKRAKGEMVIKESNLLCHNGYLQEAGLMEFIAQTAAAYTGYKQLTAKKEVSEGYIGAVKNLVIHSLPPAGKKIQSEITVDNELLGYTIVTGRFSCENQLIAECEMRILLKPNSVN